MNSRDATFVGVNVAVELNAMPIPTPNINTPARIARTVELKKPEDVDLRLIIVFYRAPLAGSRLLCKDLARNVSTVPSMPLKLSTVFYTNQHASVSKLVLYWAAFEGNVSNAPASVGTAVASGSGWYTFWHQWDGVDRTAKQRGGFADRPR